MFVTRWRPVVAAVVVVGLLLSCAPTAASAAGDVPIPGSDAPNAVPDHYLIGLRDTAAAGAAALVKRYGGEVRHTYPKRNGFAARMSETQARRLAADPAVAYVHQDLYLSYLDTYYQGPPQAAAPWALDRLDARTTSYDDSYTFVGTGQGVRIYVVDSGIRITHSDFYGRASYGWDFSENDAVADDCVGHGTQVAGIAGGAAVHGVAKLAEVVALKVSGCNGPTLGSIEAALDWVAINAVRPAVVTLSVGQPSNCSILNFVACIIEAGFESSVEDVIDAGVPVVAAAGNDNRDACDMVPTGANGIIVVGSTDETDTRAPTSNYGSCVDIFAPGEWVETLDYSSDTGQILAAGTSLAAAHVAGVMAQMLSAHPEWTPNRATGALLIDAAHGVVIDPGFHSPNLMVHSWTGLEEFFCERTFESFRCEVQYFDGPGPDTAEVVRWWQSVNHGTETYQWDWEGQTFVFTTCVVGWNYRFRIELIHASGLYVRTGWRSYLCTSNPHHL